MWTILLQKIFVKKMTTEHAQRSHDLSYKFYNLISSRTIHADGLSFLAKNGCSRTLQVQEPLVLELICSRTSVHKRHLFKTFSS